MITKINIILFLLFSLAFDINAQSQFIDSNIPIVGVWDGAAEWGDYDNDNDLDLVVTGRKDNGERISVIYRNDGINGFIDIKAILIGVYYSSAEWGDIDCDGDLDLLISGDYLGGPYGAGVLKIYRNDGNDNFVEKDFNLPGIYLGQASWDDLDNDGDLDIAATGVSGEYNKTTFILENINNNEFVKISEPFYPINNSFLSLVDYDNDNDIDFYISGHKGSLENFASMYQNEGNLQFISNNLGFPRISHGTIAWNDYDSDGDLDALVTGSDDKDYTGEDYSDLYINDGLGNFSLVDIHLIKLRQSDAIWGDLDNDGDLDLLLAGDPNQASLDYITKLYKNDGNNIFVDTQENIIGFSEPTIALGDYDNDGDLDFIICGNSNKNRLSKIYRNEINTSNSKPMSPTNLNSEVDSYSVTLSWDKSIDNETPFLGLSYNLRIGTTQFGSEIVSCHSDPFTGFRKVVKIGNVQQNKTWMIHKLEGGKYYWTVQAIDHSFQGSNFSPVETFEIKPRPPVLNFPSDSSTNIPININLNWSSPRGAEIYHIQVSIKKDFSSILVDEVLVDTSYQLTNLEYFTTYFWRVKTKNNAGVSNWSNIYQFTTKLQAPQLIFPENNSEKIPLEVTLMWNSVFGAETYTLQLSKNLDFQDYYEVQLVDTFFISSDLQSYTIYKWRVYASNSGGNSDWSAIWKFKTLLKAPKLLSPPDSSIQNDTKITLYWESVFDSARYHLQVATDLNFNYIHLDQSEISDTTYELTELSDSTIYYWHVKASYKNDNSEWSSSNYFKIEIPSSVNEKKYNPFQIKLLQNYPNPFNPVTTIKYNLSKSSDIILKIYNISGQEIEILINGFQTAGEHEKIWQPKGLPSGIYFYKLQADEFSDSKKLILQR